MNFHFNTKALITAMLLTATSAPLMTYAAPPATVAAQQIYATPEAAVQALIDALRSNDKLAVLGVLGGASAGWLNSGDDVADRADRDHFLAAFTQKHSIQSASDAKAQLIVGDSDWPFPAPLKHKAEGWVFDTEAGRQEILARRIGQNELDTIQTLLAVVDAQREYAAGDRDGNGSLDYARRFLSNPGQKDGLYWPTAANEAPSPLGGLIGAAAREGYAKKNQANKPVPYRGYHYRMLTEQGASAPGGIYNYSVNGKLIGGFAVLAYPAKYGISGVMTFMVNHQGVVYQQDLGKTTESRAQKIQRYSPDTHWQKAE